MWLAKLSFALRREYLVRTLGPGQAALALLSDDAARRGGHSFSRADVRRRGLFLAPGCARLREAARWRDAVPWWPPGGWPAPGSHKTLDRAGHRRRTGCRLVLFSAFTVPFLFQVSASPPSRTPSRPRGSRTPSRGRARAASSWTAAAITPRCPTGECRWTLIDRRTQTQSPSADWLEPVPSGAVRLTPLSV